MGLKVIITGVTGMVGEGVLHECLHHADIDAVLTVGRRSCGVLHSKLREIIRSDFFDISGIEDQLKGYDACFFCLGVSSVGMKERDYSHITYDLTLAFAKTLLKHNSSMTFCYVSGAGTDSSENGRSMWARVKGKTENDLLALGFRQAYMFRPGYMQPTKGLKNTKRWYFVFGPFYPLWRAIFPKFVSTLRELGLAMINVAIKGYDKQVLATKDIVLLAGE